MKAKFTRMTAYTIIVVIIFGILLSRLFYLQVLNGDYYRGVAEARAEREISDVPTRGDILDRNSIKIATNIQSFNVIYSLSLEKRENSKTNQVLIDTIKIIFSNNDKEKINTDSLPINYDEVANVFTFNFNTKNQSVIESKAKAFKKSNDIDINLDAKDTFFKLAEKYELIKNYNAGQFENTYDISPDIMHKVVVVRQAIKGIAYKQYETIYIANNVKKDTAFLIDHRSSELTGISCEVEPLRYYPYGEVGSAFIGYMGKISSNVEEYERLGYDVNKELIGKDRLEKVLENNRELNIQLRGEPGVEYVKVDKFGKVIERTSWRDSIPGDTVITTIDMELQKVAEKAFDQMMQDIRDGKFSTSEKYPNANRGALVVLDANSGEILALVSRPGFDPNLFAETGGIKDPEVYNKLFLPDVKDIFETLPKPMFNYATQGTAPPGSIFKMFSGIAALEENKTNTTEEIYDQGVYKVVPGFAGKCWIYDDYGRTHGSVNIAEALQKSCNYFFYEMGRRLGFDKIGEWAAKFGLGRDPETNERPTTGIEIYESTGTVGSPKEYKLSFINSKMRNLVDKLSEANYGGYTLTEGTDDYKSIVEMFMNGIEQYDEEKYKELGITDKNKIEEAIELEYKSTLISIGIINDKAQKLIIKEIKNFDTESSRPGDPLITAIGQGATNLTPLQMAQSIATIVNGGTRYKAHLIKQVLNPDGSIKKTFEPEVITKLNLKKENIDIIKEGMKKVNEEGGTASSVFRNYPIETGGKTGTAQFSKNQAEMGRAAYGWFAGFAPYENPEIVVVGVVYDGGHGNYVARAVKEVYDQYFSLADESKSEEKK